MTRIIDPDLAAFVDMEDEPFAPIVADRTSLERTANCPAMAGFYEMGVVTDNSTIAAAGEEVHQSFGATIREYIATDEVVHPGVYADSFRRNLYAARPDVQSEAVSAGVRSAWPFAQFLNTINPHNILHYDGGDGARSGQLSWDLEGLGVRVTSELDLLYAGQSPEVLEEVDYKTGWKTHTIDDIAASFQFQCHAWLALNNYPDEKIEALRVRVWNTRTSGLSPGVLFYRRNLSQWSIHIAAAAGLLKEYRGTSPDNRPAWPAPEKCVLCRAAAHCMRREKPAGDVAADPVRWVQNLAVAEEAAAQMRKSLGAYVELTKQDIVTPEGYAFGTAKPKADRKPTKSLYTLKPQVREENEMSELN